MTYVNPYGPVPTAPCRPWVEPSIQPYKPTIQPALPREKQWSAKIFNGMEEANSFMEGKNIREVNTINTGMGGIIYVVYYEVKV